MFIKALGILEIYNFAEKEIQREVKQGRNLEVGKKREFWQEFLHQKVLYENFSFYLNNKMFIEKYV